MEKSGGVIRAEIGQLVEQMLVLLGGKAIPIALHRMGYR